MTAGKSSTVLTSKQSQELIWIKALYIHKKNQLTVPSLPLMARGAADSAQVRRQKSLALGMGNGNKQQGMPKLWRKRTELISQLTLLLLKKHLEGKETLKSLAAGTQGFKEGFLVGSMFISLFVCPSLYFTQKCCHLLTLHCSWRRI